VQLFQKRAEKQGRGSSLQLYPAFPYFPLQEGEGIVLLRSTVAEGCLLKIIVLVGS
jgi:hypothetical protein